VVPERAAEASEAGAHGGQNDYTLLAMVAHGVLRAGVQQAGRADGIGFGICPRPKGASSEG
jgi:hypothetical protein